MRLKTLPWLENDYEDDDDDDDYEDDDDDEDGGDDGDDDGEISTLVLCNVSEKVDKGGNKVPPGLHERHSDGDDDDDDYNDDDDDDDVDDDDDDDNNEDDDGNFANELINHCDKSSSIHRFRNKAMTMLPLVVG